MQQVLMILHLVFAVALVVLILLQQGKGAATGAAFGAGASQTVFGSQGAGSFMLKITGLFGLLFFVTSLALGHISGDSDAAKESSSVLNSVEKISVQQKQQQEAAKKVNSVSLPTPIVSQ